MNYTLTLPPPWSGTAFTEVTLLFPTSQKSVTLNNFSKEEKKHSLIMGLIFSFAAGASFGSYTFRNKCLSNNGQRTCQGKGVKSDGGGREGKEDQSKTRGEIKGVLENEKCGEIFIFTYTSLKICIIF